MRHILRTRRRLFATSCVLILTLMLLVSRTISAADIHEIRAEIRLQRRILEHMSVRTICDFPAIDRLVLGMDGLERTLEGGTVRKGMVFSVRPQTFEKDRHVWFGKECINSAAASKTLLAVALDRSEGFVWDGTFRKPSVSFPRAEQCELTDDGAYLATRRSGDVLVGATTEPFDAAHIRVLLGDQRECLWIGTSPHIGRKLVLAIDNGDVLMLDIEQPDTLRKIGFCEKLAEASDIALGHTGLMLAWTTPDGVWLSNLDRQEPGKHISTVRGPTKLVFGPGDEFLAVACGATDIVFVDVKRPQAHSKVTVSNQYPVSSLIYSPSRKLFFAGTFDGELAAIHAEIKTTPDADATSNGK